MYDALRRKAQEIIERERRRFEAEVTGRSEENRLRLNSTFNLVASGLRNYVGLAEKNHWPIGSDFERDEPLYSSNTEYSRTMDGIKRHLKNLRSMPIS